MNDNTAAVNSRRKIILSGIQPTGTFTLGNYLGAVKNWRQLQKAARRLPFCSRAASTRRRVWCLSRATFPHTHRWAGCSRVSARSAISAA